MAGGPNAAVVMCMHCTGRAIRAWEGPEDDWYRCDDCGREFGVDWRRGQPAKACWPPTPEELADARRVLDLITVRPRPKETGDNLPIPQILFDSLSMKCEKRLGGGRYAEVFAAFDGTRPVVVKVARLQPKDDPTATNAAFVTAGMGFHTGGTGAWDPAPNDVLAAEANVMRTVTHPSFVKVLADGIWDDAEGERAYVVYERVMGTSWREALTGARPPTLGHLAQVVDALAQARASGQLPAHGDIKPDNLMIDGRSEARIIDPSAGLNEFSPRLSIPIRMLLTPVYNPRLEHSDVPAIGLTGIEILTGRQAFAFAHHGRRPWKLGPRLQETLHGLEVLGKSRFFRAVPFIELPRDLNPYVPVEVERILLRCIGIERSGPGLEASECRPSFEQLAQVFREHAGLSRTPPPL